MTDLCIPCDGEPFAPSLLKEASDFGIEICAHEDSNIAKFCYVGKQHFASHQSQTQRMAQKPINDVLAENLAHFMGVKKLNQTTLGSRAGVGQTTVGVYLFPKRRQLGAKGKAPSAKLSEVELLAEALEVEVWELLRPLSPEARQAYEKIEAAFIALNPQVQDTSSGGVSPESGSRVRTGTHN